MSQSVIASLSDQAWVTDKGKILAYLVSYYILSDAAQSLVFQGNIINLPETYYKYINEPDNMALGVKQDLEKLLNRYYELVDVTTEAKEIGNGGYGILLHASVVDSYGVKHNLSKVVEMDTSGVRRVIDASNYGDAKSAMTGIL